MDATRPIDELRHTCGAAACDDRPDVTPGQSLVLAAIVMQIGMRPRTKAKILAMLPVVQVMARAPARQSVVGDLIVHVTGCGQQLVGALKHRHLHLLIRQGKLAELLSPIERRALLDAETIHGNMGRDEGNGLVEAPLPGG
jgi:hypothetical protein